SAGGTGVDTLASFVESLMSGSIDVIDLTQPLSEATPMIQLPPPFANTPNWRTHEISHYDEKGPAWYWNWFEGGEHAGTHFDAPIHWITGKDRDDVAQVPVRRLVGPAVVIDKSREALANLAKLPPTGAVLLVAPLKLVKGSGSPCRALALVQR